MQITRCLETSLEKKPTQNSGTLRNPEPRTPKHGLRAGGGWHRAPGGPGTDFSRGRAGLHEGSTTRGPSREKGLTAAPLPRGLSAREGGRRPGAPGPRAEPLLPTPKARRRLSALSSAGWPLLLWGQQNWPHCRLPLPTPRPPASPPTCTVLIFSCRNFIKRMGPPQTPHERKLHSKSFRLLCNPRMRVTRTAPVTSSCRVELAKCASPMIWKRSTEANKIPCENDCIGLEIL